MECARAKPVRQTERNMIAVCQGAKSKNDMIVEAVEQYKDMFVRARANFDKVTSVMMNIGFTKHQQQFG